MAVKERTILDDSIRKKKYTSENEFYSYKDNLLKNKQIDKNFLLQLNNLTLEDLIYLKLDQVSKNLNGKFYGFPIFDAFTSICREAFLRYALSSTKSKKEAAMIMKTSKSNLNYLTKKYKIDEEF